MTLLYNTVCLFGAVYLFFVAMYRWKPLMLAWREIDNVFLIPPYSTKVKGLCFSVKLRIYAILMFVLVLCKLRGNLNCFHRINMCLFLVDHCIFMYSAIDRNERIIKYCDPNKRDFWKNFFVYERFVKLIF